MKLKIWKEGIEGDADQLYLKLVEDATDIEMVACDKDGTTIEQGHILHVDNDYRVIILIEGISQKIPLKTDLRDSVLCCNSSEISEIVKERGMNSIMKQMYEKHKAEHENERPEEIKH